VNRHQDRLNKGWAISKADHEEDFNLIREMGATALRLAHYQHDQYFYDLADKYGMVVWAEIPLVNKITQSTAFYENTQQQLTELIRQNFNHPSICFWSIANEVTSPPDPNPLLQQLADLVAAEDPTRLSTLASCCVGENDVSTRHTDVVGFNRYYGWYYGSYNDFAGWADRLHWNYPAKVFAVSEFGAGASISFHSETPTRQDHTEEYQNLFHEAHWKAMKDRKFLWGKFVWNMFDFASARRREGDTPGRNDKGLVTYDRQTRKDAFYWYKANWSCDPVVYITSRRFTERSDPTTAVKVYSNADSVELFVNGMSAGVKGSSDRIFSWDNVTLLPGDNTIEADGTVGGTTYTDSVVWTLTG
jgi:beta-galactosidase